MCATFSNNVAVQVLVIWTKNERKKEKKEAHVYTFLKLEKFVFSFAHAHIYTLTLGGRGFKESTFDFKKQLLKKIVELCIFLY